MREFFKIFGHVAFVAMWSWQLWRTLKTGKPLAFYDTPSRHDQPGWYWFVVALMGFFWAFGLLDLFGALD